MRTCDNCQREFAAPRDPRRKGRGSRTLLTCPWCGYINGPSFVSSNACAEHMEPPSERQSSKRRGGVGAEAVPIEPYDQISRPSR
jgi:hypothetical protein